MQAGQPKKTWHQQRREVPLYHSSSEKYRGNRSGTRKTAQQLRLETCYNAGRELSTLCFGSNAVSMRCVTDVLNRNNGCFVALSEAQFKEGMVNHLKVAMTCKGGLLNVNKNNGSAGLPPGLTYSMPDVKATIDHYLQKLKVAANADGVLEKISMMLR